MPRFHVDGKVAEGVDLLKRRGTAWRLDVWPFAILYSAWIFTIVPSLDFADALIVLGCLSAVHILTLLFTAWSVNFRCFVQFKKAKDIHDAEACKITPAKFSGTKEIVPLLKRRAVELCRGLEAVLGSSFGSDPFVPPPNPLIIVISGPSGVGKDAVIKGLREVREGIHFVVTATSRAKRPGEVEGKDYYFITKEEFLSMIEKDELLEYALVYGEYKGIPKQQIRDFMAKGYDIVLRVDIQGAATLRSILGKSAIFIFLVAESEEALVKRLIDRKTETTESLLVRVATAREEVKHLKEFDYVVVNAEGKLDNAVDLMESIIDAEKARVRQRFVKI